MGFSHQTQGIFRKAQGFANFEWEIAAEKLPKKPELLKVLHHSSLVMAKLTSNPLVYKVGSATAPTTRRKLDSTFRTDSLSSDQSENVRPPPPRPHKPKNRGVHNNGSSLVGGGASDLISRRGAGGGEVGGSGLKTGLGHRVS